MHSTKLHNTTFTHCLQASWGFLAVAISAVVAGITGFIEPKMIAILALPMGLGAMCWSLYAVMHSGEEVMAEEHDRAESAGS